MTTVRAPARETSLVMVALIFLRAIPKVVAAYCIAQGLTIMLAGPDRFADVSYRVILSTPGAPRAWGVGILAVGGLIVAGAIAGSERVEALGMFGAAIWSMVFATAFLIATATNHSAGITQVLAYGKDAALFTLFGSMLWRHWDARHRDPG